MNRRLLVGLDVGGSFTDVVVHDGVSGATWCAKAPNRAGHLLDSVEHCLKQVSVPWSEVDILKHGTTVVINTIVQRSGARTALITTEGCRDVLEIGRTNWPEPYNLRYDRLPPLVPRELRFELAERVGADGAVVRELDREQLGEIIAQLRLREIEAVAVCFLHSYRNPDHEIEVGRFLQRELPDVYVSLSHELTREFREYERTSTAVVNAYVGPPLVEYLSTLKASVTEAGLTGEIVLMESNGGASTIAAAQLAPVALVESGPAAGAIAVGEVSRELGLDKVIAFDMGGTTAKAALVEDYQPLFTAQYYVPSYERGYPIQVGAVDIVEVGTGGGSIALVDSAGALTVGPESAGAFPGPACYAQGGEFATVTDANVMLGRIDPARFQTGDLVIDRDRAEAVLEQLGARTGQTATAMAWGILRVANFNMAAAIRRVSIERGRDPREFTLFAYGGGGGLHAGDLARDLGIPHVIVPQLSSNFSAFGTLLADLRTDVTRTIMTGLDDVGSSEWLRLDADMLREACEWHGCDEGRLRFERTVDARYVGQEFTLRVAADGAGEHLADSIRQEFTSEYNRRYGHSFDELPVEIVNMRLAASLSTVRPSLAHRHHTAQDAVRSSAPDRSIYFGGHGFIDATVIERDELKPGATVVGPAAIEEYGTTTILAPGDSLVVDDLGQLRVGVGQGGTE